MQGELANLEAILLEGGRIDLDQGALIASGVETEPVLNSYLARIGQLCHRIAAKDFRSKGSDVERARAIFHWLWRTKPYRHQYRGNFKLTDVLDAQLGEKDEVGNCLGLTVLYNVLCRRFGLEVKAVQMEHAFGLGPHVFSVLYVAGRSIDIENVFPYGFDYRGHKGDPQRKEWGSGELGADIYHSRANSLFERGKLDSAIENYDRAIRLNPKYAKARLNKGIALVELGRLAEASERFRD
ncbi:MAG: tetratricopeptide repeat protein [Dehalococcoidia bacterium]